MTIGDTFRLEAPRLRTVESPGAERHSTWFELYFDLVFVAAVAELASGLARDPSAPVFARFAGLFVVVGWVWVGFTIYANRFDTDDIVFRVAKAAAVFAVAGMAIEIPRVIAGHGGTAAFAACYAITRVILVALYVRARLSVGPQWHRLIDIYIWTFGLTTVLWIASIFVPEPGRVILWCVALLIDFATPPSAWRLLGSNTIVVSHLTDRFGTFFIIVLGEAVVSVITAVAGHRLGFHEWLVLGTCFVVALCLWWIYFDLADTSVLGRGALGIVYLYAHNPLLAGVAAFGAGARLAVVDASHGALTVGTRWALGGGIAAFSLALALLHIGAEWTSLRDPTFIGRLVLGSLAVGLAAFGAGLTPLVFVLLIAAAVLAQLLLEAFTFPTGAASVWEPTAPGEAGGRAQAQAVA